MNIYIAIDEDREIIGVGCCAETDLIQEIYIKYQHAFPEKKILINCQHKTDDFTRYSFYIGNDHICDFIVEIHESL